MSTWSELRAVLIDLESRNPRPLTEYPDPRSAHRDGPLSVALAAWAELEAAAIYQRFGEDVALSVGAFSYPDLASPGSRSRRPEQGAPSADTGLLVSLHEALVVRSGHTLHATVDISNDSHGVVEIWSGRHLSAFVIDREGRIVGGATGPITAVGRRLTVAAGASVASSVLVGTDSLDPALGYAVPPGEWHIEVILNVRDGARLRSAPLPLTVTG